MAQQHRSKPPSVSPRFVITQFEEGYRVYSPAEPSKSYIVSGSPERPACTCSDAQCHGNDPSWRCVHVQAVLLQHAQHNRVSEPPDQYEAEERAAIEREALCADPPSAVQLSPAGNSQMLLKRSISPDGRIDSLSVEFTSPVDGIPASDIKERALKTLHLQADIVDGFLKNSRNGTRPAHPPTNGNGQRTPPNGGPQPATLVNVAGLDGRNGRSLFINVQVNGKTLKLFGSKKQLGEQLTSAGYPHLAPHVMEGMALQLPCGVTTKPSMDGKYVNVDKLLPSQQAEVRS